MRAGVVPCLLCGALLLTGPGGAARALPLDATPCTADGAPPIQTDTPVTVPLFCTAGGKLSYFDQEGTLRFACINPPAQSRGEARGGRKWPLLVYLHGSLTTPESLYLEGHNLLDLHDTFQLSGNPAVEGFYIVSPEGRRATPWPAPGGNGPITGTGFHWDEWYRNSTDNLDAQAIDHFVDEVVATGQIDTSRIYVFGWSNGAFMAMLYGNWRSDRVAAIAQYAGANPWSRTPCPVSVQATRKVPLVLMRNLCDALVPCSETDDWVTFLTQQGWPFQYHSLTASGAISAGNQCQQSCGSVQGLFDHVRWPDTAALETMLSYLRKFTLP